MRAKISKQVRLLQAKWAGGNSWPQRLESLEIEGLRGWTGQRIDFKFPIVAISGENGSGKSTILQSAASVYSIHAPALGEAPHASWFASDFFPDTPWDAVTNATIRFWVRQGTQTIPGSVRKPTDRWRGNPSRPVRNVEYIDLARIQPVSARTGYSRLAKAAVKETSSKPFEKTTLERLSEIMGRTYSAGKMAVTDADDGRAVPVVSINDNNISGFHLGAGEFTMTELLLQLNLPKYSLLIIDEIETSLHPRAQRRLIRDLAEICRVNELQVILTTHSPYILAELPAEARGYILTSGGTREVVFGVSPDFAMSQMDEEIHPECDLYVEDDQAKLLLQEILFHFGRDLLNRVQIIPYGAANIGQSLGIMVNAKRFPRPSVVFLDGDQPEREGCVILPGGDAPERAVFESLKAKQWFLLDAVTTREFASLSEALNKAMTASDHHEWITLAAGRVVLDPNILWQAMCAEWTANCLKAEDGEKIITAIREALI
jgi:predicted ATPase